MRNETTLPNGNPSSLHDPNKIETTYSNKTIVLELKNTVARNILEGSFQNGQLPPSEIVLERAVDGYNFEKIGNISEGNLNQFKFEDENKYPNNRCSYRLLVREPNGVTYYSEILSYVN